eukprot:Gregarina_sp_Poly_1__1427@NODE_1356_length_4306_cov_69_264685_g66_i1_p1_GENE_NODE_1356_length_4306_cov_69_264685_g66_i1NODE_1356_length_4306_cov_69_264685_g66_i1_p1_ORF_typecomplete_len784_score108_73SNF2_N/PF00176_23/4_8e09_NODE_1356_length_4306_cov_69_264685_g66_i1492352
MSGHLPEVVELAAKKRRIDTNETKAKPSDEEGTSCIELSSSPSGIEEYVTEPESMDLIQKDTNLPALSFGLSDYSEHSKEEAKPGSISSYEISSTELQGVQESVPATEESKAEQSSEIGSPFTESSMKAEDVISVASNNSDIQLIRDDFNYSLEGQTVVLHESEPDSDSEYEVNQPLAALRCGRRIELEDPCSLQAEPDFPELIPQESRLQVLWPTCVILHTYLIVAADFAHAYRLASSYADCRFRIFTYIDSATETWIAEVGVLTPEGRVIAGRLPPVTSAILEVCLMTKGVNFMTRTTVEDPGEDTLVRPPICDHSGESSTHVPVTICLHSPKGGDLIGLLLADRHWAQYIRRRYTGQLNSLPRVLVNLEGLSPTHYSTNLHCKDCILTALMARERGDKKPNIDFAFNDEKRLQENAWESAGVAAKGRLQYPPSFAWSGLPRGLRSFRQEYQSEMVNVFQAWSSEISRHSLLWTLNPGARTLNDFFDADSPDTPSDDAVLSLLGPGYNLGSSNASEISSPRSRLDLLGTDESGKVSRPQRTVHTHLVKIDDIKSKLNDVLASRDFDSMPECNAHVYGLNVTLMPHQRKGVQWMLDREKEFDLDKDFDANGRFLYWQRTDDTMVRNVVTASNYSLEDISDKICPRGGILADDMGLGKTVQSLALILKDDESQEKLRQFNEDVFMIGGRRKRVMFPKTSKVSKMSKVSPVVNSDRNSPNKTSAETTMSGVQANASKTHKKIEAGSRIQPSSMPAISIVGVELYHSST